MERFLPWFMFWADKWLNGSVSVTFSLEEQAILVKLLCLASKSPKRGTICASPTVAFPLEDIARQCKCSIKKLQATLDQGMRDKNNEDDKPMITVENGFVTFNKFRELNDVPDGRQKHHETPTERELREARTWVRLSQRYGDRVLVDGMSGEILNPGIKEVLGKIGKGKIE